MTISLETGTPQFTRRLNRALILDRIRVGGVVSRAELAKVTSIRPPTVTAIIRDLLSEGLVVERGIGKPRGGRAPRLLTLSCDFPQVLAFELTDSALLAGLSDLSGQLQARRSVPYRPDTPERTVEKLKCLAEELFEDVRGMKKDGEFGWENLRGVGVALPGLIDFDRSVVQHSQPLDWHGVALRELCEAAWSVKTDVINDSLAGGMAAQFLDSPNVRNLVYVVLRFQDASNGVVGIGTGLIVNGEPFHGENGLAGEVTVPVTHPLVDARDVEGHSLPDTEAFVAALQNGVPGAVRAMDRVAGELSLLIAHAINLFDPGRLTIESDVPALGEALLVRFREFRKRAGLRTNGDASQTEVRLSNLGEFGGVRGAAVPALRRFFRLPHWS